MSEQPLDEGVTGLTDVFALAQAPLGVTQLVGDRLGRQVLVDGTAAARSELSKMGGDELVVVEQLHGGLGGAQPQVLAHHPERGGVVGLLELHVAVGVELDPCPHGELGRARGERAQELALGLDEAPQGLLVGGAVDAVAGGAEHPGAQHALASTRSRNSRSGTNERLRYFTADSTRPLEKAVNYSRSAP